MKHLVIGKGEVGTAVSEVLDCDVCDVEGTEGIYDCIHICFPYCVDFRELVEGYAEDYEAPYVVVHSTVPVDTCVDWTHSPVRGVHPDLAESLTTFTKYFGGPDAEDVAAEWPGPTHVFPDSRTCEALKLWSTEQYREFILLNKKIHKWCKKNRIKFDDIYTHANETYNEGYLKMGRKEVVRPYLKYMEGPIGGHCVEPNHKLLNAE